MVFMPPTLSGGNADDGLAGYSYGAVLVAADAAGSDELQEVLRGIRFSGWITPPSDGWVVVLGDPGAGVVATGGRGIVEVGAIVAERFEGVVLAVRVLADRQLGIVVWVDGEEIGRYCSDPSREPGADKDVLDQPVGDEDAAAFAEACGRPDAEEQLTELLGEELDPESTNESERLGQVARLLGLPRWLVAVGSLPHDIPFGPALADLVRLRVGEVGAAGFTRNVAVSRSRRRRTPPPIIEDPPRTNMSGLEPWMF